MDSDHGRVLAGILNTAENAAPVDAVEAGIRELAAALNAGTVSFLIADLSGRALVRLAHVPFHGAGEVRRAGDEVATVLPFDGGPAEQALRTQTVQTRDMPLIMNCDRLFHERIAAASGNSILIEILKVLGAARVSRHASRLASPRCTLRPANG